jgi:hypothetical protein
VPAQATVPTVAANRLNEILISDAGGADQHGRAGADVLAVHVRRLAPALPQVPRLRSWAR